MNISFNDYWKAKAAKRRKTWSATTKRFAERHTQMEDIRLKVFKPLDYNLNFSFEDYLIAHHSHKNSMIHWEQMKFNFSEFGLREELIAEGADMRSFKMETEQCSIDANNIPKPKNHWPNYVGIANCYLYEMTYHAWLRRVFSVCNNMETVRLTYGQVTMTIKRYSNNYSHFAYYEINPCEQLIKSAMMLQETDFSMLSVATLLMEMNAEWNLREEELNYHIKKLRLRTMAATVTDGHIEFTLWDDIKLEKKIDEYLTKNYTLKKIMDKVLQPWKSAINTFFNLETIRTLNEQTQRLWNKQYYYAQRNISYIDYITNEISTQFEKEDLRDVKLTTFGKNIIMNYRNNKCLIKISHNIELSPNSCLNTTLTLHQDTPISALSNYLTQMPAINSVVNNYVLKVLQLFNQKTCIRDNYNNAVQHLNSLIAKHEGKPVIKLIKCILWNIDCLISHNKIPKINLTSIQVTSDTSFSFIENDASATSNAPKNIYREYWIDTDCNYVYDLTSWQKQHATSSYTPQFKIRIAEFIDNYCSDNSKSFISIDFINEIINTHGNLN